MRSQFIRVACLIALTCGMSCGCSNSKQNDVPAENGAQNDISGPQIASPIANSEPEPGDEIVFKKIGSKVEIDFTGEQRIVYLYDADDSSKYPNPSKITFFHDPLCTLRRAKQPVAGYPVWVQSAKPDGSSSAITNILVAFDFSTEEFRNAAAAKLRNDLAQPLRKLEVEHSLSSVSIELERIPIIEFRVQLYDSDKKLVIAEAVLEVVKSLTVAELKFSLDDQQLALFKNAIDDKCLMFRPYYKAKASHLLFAKQTAAGKVDVALKITQAMASMNLKSNKPLLQDQYNEIARSVTSSIHSDVITNAPELITYFRDMSLLVKPFFEDETMSYDAFRQANPTFSDQALAEHLRPLVQRAISRDVTINSKGSAEQKQQLTRGTAGLKIGIPIGDVVLGIGLGADLEESEIRLINQTTGLQLEKAKERSWYLPKSVKYYKLNKGQASNQFAVTQHVRVQKSGVQEYLNISPLKPTLSEELEPSLEKTRLNFDSLATLLKLKQRLEDELKSELGDLTKLNGESKSLNLAIEEQRAAMSDAKTKALVKIKDDIVNQDWWGGFYVGASDAHTMWSKLADSYVSPAEKLQENFQIASANKRAIEEQHEKWKSVTKPLRDLGQASFTKAIKDFDTANLAITELGEKHKAVNQKLDQAIAKCEQLALEINLTSAEISAILKQR